MLFQMTSIAEDASTVAGTSSGSGTSSKTNVQAKIREELSNMSFEELRKLKEELGTKIVNTTLFGKAASRNRGKPEFKRDNKNRPSEISSKQRPRRDGPKVFKKPVKIDYIFRDPRFDDLSGTLNDKLFKQSYGFLYEMKSKEIQILKDHLVKATDEMRKKDIRNLIQKMESELKAKEQKDKREDMDKNWKHKQVEKVREGKKPFYLKNSEKKKQDLIEKFEALKKAGKLEQYLAKKRKKNASKQKKKLPPNVN